MKVYCFPVSCKQADSVMHKVAVHGKKKCFHHIYSQILDVTTREKIMSLKEQLPLVSPPDHISYKPCFIF